MRKSKLKGLLVYFLYSIKVNWPKKQGGFDVWQVDFKPRIFSSILFLICIIPFVIFLKGIFAIPDIFNEVFNQHTRLMYFEIGSVGPSKFKAAKEF